LVQLAGDKTINRMGWQSRSGIQLSDGEGAPGEGQDGGAKRERELEQWKKG